jgi:large subunit ribosomal protein L25
MDVELNAQVRAESGKGVARRLRRAEFVPAIVYGPRTSPLPIAVPVKRLEKVLQDTGREARLIRLTVDGDSQNAPRHVLIREMQVHPVRRQFLHVDFYEVSMDQPIVTDVPVELVGEPIGIKMGGMLNLLRRTLSVRCLPGEIPEKVRIEVSGMNVGDTLHVSDLIEQASFDLVDDTSFAVVSVSGPEGGKAGGEAEKGAEE